MFSSLSRHISYHHPLRSRTCQLLPTRPTTFLLPPHYAPFQLPSYLGLLTPLTLTASEPTLPHIPINYQERVSLYTLLRNTQLDNNSTNVNNNNENSQYILDTSDLTTITPYTPHGNSLVINLFGPHNPIFAQMIAFNANGIGIYDACSSQNDESHTNSPQNTSETDFNSELPSKLTKTPWNNPNLPHPAILSKQNDQSLVYRTKLAPPNLNSSNNITSLSSFFRVMFTFPFTIYNAIRYKLDTILMKYYQLTGSDSLKLKLFSLFDISIPLSSKRYAPFSSVNPISFKYIQPTTSFFDCVLDEYDDLTRITNVTSEVSEPTHSPNHNHETFPQNTPNISTLSRIQPTTQLTYVPKQTDLDLVERYREITTALLIRYISYHSAYQAYSQDKPLTVSFLYKVVEELFNGDAFLTSHFLLKHRPQIGELAGNFDHIIRDHDPLNKISGKESTPVTISSNVYLLQAWSKHLSSNFINVYDLIDYIGTCTALAEILRMPGYRQMMDHVITHSNTSPTLFSEMLFTIDGNSYHSSFKHDPAVHTPTWYSARIHEYIMISEAQLFVQCFEPSLLYISNALTQEYFEPMQSQTCLSLQQYPQALIALDDEKMGNPYIMDPPAIVNDMINDDNLSTTIIDFCIERVTDWSTKMSCTSTAKLISTYVEPLLSLSLPLPQTSLQDYKPLPFRPIVAVLLNQYRHLLHLLGINKYIVYQRIQTERFLLVRHAFKLMATQMTHVETNLMTSSKAGAFLYPKYFQTVTLSIIVMLLKAVANIDIHLTRHSYRWDAVAELYTRDHWGVDGLFADF